MKCICQYDQTLHLLNRRMNTHSLVENDYVALLYSWDIRKMVVLIMLEPISKFLFVCSGRVNYNRTALDFFSLTSGACYVCLSLQMLWPCAAEQYSFSYAWCEKNVSRHDTLMPSPTPHCIWLGTISVKAGKIETCMHFDRGGGIKI